VIKRERTPTALHCGGLEQKCFHFSSSSQPPPTTLALKLNKNDLVCASRTSQPPCNLLGLFKPLRSTCFGYSRLKPDSAEYSSKHAQGKKDYFFPFLCLLGSPTFFFCFFRIFLALCNCLCCSLPAAFSFLLLLAMFRPPFLLLNR